MSEQTANGGKRRPERPPDCPDRLRTMIWYDAVWLARHHARSTLGKTWQSRPEVRELTKHFGKWAPYRRGENVPKDPSPQTNPIEIAEAAVPGTANWFRSPIWKAIHGELTGEMPTKGGKPPGIFDNHLFAIKGAANMLFENTGELDGRPIKSISLEGVISCGALTGLELVETVVLLFEREYALSWPELKQSTLSLYRDSTEKIARILEISRNYGAFLNLIEMRYCRSATDRSDHYLEPWYIRLRGRPGFNVARQLLGPTSDKVIPPEAP